MNLFNNPTRIANVEAAQDQTQSRESSAQCVGVNDCVLNRSKLREILLSNGTARHLPDGAISEGTPLADAGPAGSMVKEKLLGGGQSVEPELRGKPSWMEQVIRRGGVAGHLPEDARPEAFDHSSNGHRAHSRLMSEGQGASPWAPSGREKSSRENVVKRFTDRDQDQIRNHVQNIRKGFLGSSTDD